MFSKIQNLINDILFPPICLICKNYLNEEWRGKFICETCLNAIPFNNAFYCSECGSRRPNFNKLCHPSPAFILGAATQYSYEPVKNLIWQLKFQGQKPAACALATILSQYLIYGPPRTINWGRTFHGIIPIPLHASRQRQRGYNQSQLIAQKLIYGGSTSIDLVNDVLIRIKNTETQTDKDILNRRLNLENAFEVTNKEKVYGKNFILLDDVCTSSATLTSAVKTLKNAGARKIIGLVVAKT